MIMPQAEIARIHAVFTQGGSAPACVETADGALFVLKLKGAGGGERGLITEFLGLRIAAQLGARVPAARPLFLPHGFPWQAGTDEFDAMVQRSYGWNLGIAFLRDADEIPPADLDHLPDAFLAPLAHADAALANVDRRRAHPNILRDADAAPWAIDYGACLFLNRILEGRLDRPTALPPNHFLAATRFDRLGEKVCRPEGLDALLDETPEEWLSDLPLPAAELARRLHAYFTA